MAETYLNPGNTVLGDGKGDRFAPCPQAEKSDPRAREIDRLHAEQEASADRDRKKTSPTRKRPSRMGPRLDYSSQH